MRRLLNIAFIFCFLMLLLGTASAQQEKEDEKNKKKTRIKLVVADYMNFDKERLGPDIQRLVGNVIFEHDSMFLYCDSAYLYEKDNSMDAWGDIHIKASDSLNIYGQELRYNGNDQIAELREDVKLVDNQMTLTTDFLDYNLAENTGKYTGGGKIIDTTNQLTSDIGYYYADQKEFFFKDSVQLVNPRYTIESDTLMYNTMTEVSYFFGPSYIRSDTNLIYCENGWYDTRNNIAQFKENALLSNNKQTLQGDSLYYDRDNGFGKAYKNVSVIDSSQNIIIKGEYGYFLEEINKSLITDSAQAIQIDDGDSLFMHADTLKYLGDTTRPEGKQLFAYHKVKIYRINLQGKCDSLVYNVKDSVIRMFTEPVIWSGKSQLYADFIEFYTGKAERKKLRLYQNSYMAEMDYDTTNFNQVKGKNMIGYFNKKELYKVYVEGNAETIYFVRNDQDELVGVNKVQSSDLIIHIKSRQISNLTFKTLPSAKLHPYSGLTPSETIIKGFYWFHNDRPQSRYDIFKW